MPVRNPKARGRSVVLVAAVCFVGVAGLAACGDDSESDSDVSAGSSPFADEQPSVSPAAASGVPRGRWTGTAHVTVDFADPGCPTGSRSFDLSATLLIDAGSEGNAFHLSWASDSQTNGDGDISRQLVNSAAAQGAALNLVFVPKPILPCSDYMPFAYGMATGTTQRAEQVGANQWPSSCAGPHSRYRLG